MADHEALAAGEFSAWLDGFEGALRGEHGSVVPCDGCTACCRSSQFIHIEPDEADTLAHIPAALLVPAPGLPDGHVVMGYDEHGCCPMLVDDRCSIYEHRPRTCRTYDCRVFPATGIEPDPEVRPLLAARTRRWVFTYADDAARARHDALRADPRAVLQLSPDRAISEGQNVREHCGMTMQLASDAGPTDVPLLDETVGTNLARTIAAHGDVEALVARHQGVRWTYAEFGERVARCAKGLMALGLQPGDRVGLWSPNYAEWTLVQYATAEIGVILVNVNPAYRTHELAYALNQSGCRMLFAAPSFKTSDYMDMVEQVTPDVPGLERSIFFWEDDWDELVAGAAAISDADLAERRGGLRPDDPINIQYTSGTTGFPKGATLTHRNILNNGYFVARLQGFQTGDRLCIPVPFYHCFGMVMGNLGCTTHGATMVIPADSFEPTHVLETIEAERCTALYGVPTMFIAELGHPEFDRFDLSSLRTGVMAGSPCPVEVMKAAVDRMHMSDVTICYGMTETSPVSTQTLPDDSLHHRTATVGRAHPHVEIRIADPSTGETLARGATGEFCTRGYSVMQGYWNDADRTAEAIDTDGWMHTGDLAVMAEDGYVNIVGRSKDMVIRGGENVYPREVEEFLYTHPDVEDVQVIGVPDERYGEELMAWVRLRPGATVDADALREFCRGRIAHFKIPRYIKFVNEFPMTVTGKVQKFKMREEAIDELGLSGAATTRMA